MNYGHKFWTQGMCHLSWKHKKLYPWKYCEIIDFRGAHFSWIHENGYIPGDVISWVGGYNKIINTKKTHKQLV